MRFHSLLDAEERRACTVRSLLDADKKVLLVGLSFCSLLNVDLMVLVGLTLSSLFDPERKCW